jgi:hypothetical protein
VHLSEAGGGIIGNRAGARAEDHEHQSGSGKIL